MLAELYSLHILLFFRKTNYQSYSSLPGMTVRIRCIKAVFVLSNKMAKSLYQYEITDMSTIYDVRENAKVSNCH